MASRRKEKRIKTYSSAITQLEERVAKEWKGEFTKAEPGTRPKEKMSEVLEEFVAPCVLDDMTDKEYSALVGIGVFAWNMALSPPEERWDDFEKMASMGELPMDEDVRLIVENLIRRKETCFPSIKRLIISYQVASHKRGRLLTVASLVHETPFKAHEPDEA